MKATRGVGISVLSALPPVMRSALDEGGVFLIKLLFNERLDFTRFLSGGFHETPENIGRNAL